MNGYRASLPGRRTVIVLALLGLSALVTLPLSAQGPTKMGVIDVERILKDSVRGKAALEELTALGQEKGNELQAKKAVLEGLQSEYAQKRLSLADDKLAEMQKRLEDMQIDLQRAQDDAQREVQVVQQRKFGEIEIQVMPIINEVGKELGFALIFNKLQSGLVYADEAVDITDLVIERFNSQSGAGN